ncbi:hypothetical protein ABK040_008708 [Willaertia magna]
MNRETGELEPSTGEGAPLLQIKENVGPLFRGFILPQNEYLHNQWGLKTTRVIDAWQEMKSFGSPNIVPLPIPPYDPSPFIGSGYNMPDVFYSSSTSKPKEGEEQRKANIEIPLPSTWNFDVNTVPNYTLNNALVDALPINYGHPDLVDWKKCLKIVGQDIYTKENAKVVAPWDFIRNNNDPRPDMQDEGIHSDLQNHYTEARRKLNHGTCVSSVAVSRVAGGKMVGACPNAKLMPIRADVWNIPDHNEIAKWFDYATENGADVIIVTFIPAHPIQEDDVLYKAIEKCATRGRNGKGCVIVVGAGHFNKDISTNNSFATHPNVIAVSAITKSDKRYFMSDYEASNFGKEISVCAPGELFLSATVRGYGDDFLGKDYAMYSGTTPAASLVAGIAALVLSVNPSLDSKQVKVILQETARKVGGDHFGGHSVYFGYGCVDALAAVQKAKEMQ